MIEIPRGKFEEFNITGKGRVITVHKDDVSEVHDISVNDHILVDGEKLKVRGIEQFRNGMGGLGKNVGLLVVNPAHKEAERVANRITESLTGEGKHTTQHVLDKLVEYWEHIHGEGYKNPRMLKWLENNL